MPRRWGRTPGAEEQADVAGALLKSTDGGYRSAVEASGKPSGSECKAPKSWTYYERGEHYTVQVGTRDPLPQPAIPAAASAFRLKLRALWLRRQGLSQVEAAKKLQFDVRKLDDAWHSAAEEVPRAPQQVAKYIAAYETRMLEAGVEPFRAPCLKRGYAEHLDQAYQECASALPWEQAVLRKRNYETGGVTITDIASSRQDCSFPNLVTGMPHVDEILAKIKQDFHIEDPGAYLMWNWYLDGNTNIASHQHDFCSATLSFGAPRIFLLDGQPVLLGHGDLLVFGTQRHSVPKMPGLQEGRISVSIFWYPERRQADGVFTITLDPSQMEGALASDDMAQMIAEKAAAQYMQSGQLKTHGRGVGKREKQPSVIADNSGEDGGFLSEDRLLAIALEVSMMEQ